MRNKQILRKFIADDLQILRLHLVADLQFLRTEGGRMATHVEEAYFERTEQPWYGMVIGEQLPFAVYVLPDGRYYLVDGLDADYLRNE